MENIVPSPWNLKGNGIMLLYKFSKNLSSRECFCPDNSGNGNFSGLGAVMLVDYADSPAGPYRELLFIPGKFEFGKGKYYSITKIYVSTEVSVQSGRANWGIPKELADFNFYHPDSGRERIVVSKDSEAVLDITCKNRMGRFPLKSKFFPVSLAQNYNNQTFYTKFSGSGSARFAKVEDLSVNSDYFPDISRIRPLVAVTVRNFSIRFPVAEIEEPGIENRHCLAEKT